MAERIRAIPKIVAWKIMAIPHAVGDAFHAGTGQNRAGVLKYFFLRCEFAYGVIAGSRTTGGTDPFKMQAADVAANAAGPGGQSSPPVCIALRR